MASWMRFSRPAAIFFSQRALGTTPNIAPPSSQNGTVTNEWNRGRRASTRLPQASTFDDFIDGAIGISLRSATSALDAIEFALSQVRDTATRSQKPCFEKLQDPFFQCAISRLRRS